MLRRETVLQFTHLPTNPIWSGTESREGRKGEGDTRIKHMSKNTSAYVFLTPIESFFLLTFSFQYYYNSWMYRHTQSAVFFFEVHTGTKRCCWIWCTGQSTLVLYRMLVIIMCTELHMLINSSTSLAFHLFSFLTTEPSDCFIFKVEWQAKKIININNI